MGKRILVIDDSLTLRQFIRSTLNAQMSDAEVILAKDAREGLASAGEEAPDLILLDFILPDLRGDAVCEALLKDPKTAAVPVVLMSSNVAEITRTQGEYANVVRGLAKPFKAELLCSTITTISKRATAASANPAHPPPAVTTPPPGAEPSARTGAKPGPADASSPAAAAFGFSGDAAYFPLNSALLAIEEQRATGVLQMRVGDSELLLYVASGAVALLTCRDPQRYLEDSTFSLPQESPTAIGNARAEQSRTGKPIFLSLAQEGLIPPDAAAQLCLEQGWRLFAPAWSAAHVPFVFASSPLPEYLRDRPGFRGSMTLWALESLRRVRFEHLSRVTWCRSAGVPTFTRAGYERIQQITLNEDEVRFAELIQEPLTLEEIAEAMQVSREAAQHILHRFVCLDVCDFWPASYLQRKPAA